MTNRTIHPDSNRKENAGERRMPCRRFRSVLLAAGLHPLPKELPLYDYAPDVTVVGDYVYFCASRRGVICDFYRTRDILNGPYEKIPEPLISGILLCSLTMTEDSTSTMAVTAQLRSTE